MYKNDLALNDLHWLISHKPLPQTHPRCHGFIVSYGVAALFVFFV